MRVRVWGTSNGAQKPGFSQLLGRIGVFAQEKVRP